MWTPILDLKINVANLKNIIDRFKLKLKAVSEFAYCVGLKLTSRPLKSLFCMIVCCVSVMQTYLQCYCEMGIHKSSCASKVSIMFFQYNVFGHTTPLMCYFFCILNIREGFNF